MNKFITIYRYGDGGLKVAMFDWEDEAEEKAVEWVEGDYGRPDLPALGENKSLADKMDAIRELEIHNSFAIDILNLSPREEWSND